MGHDMDNRKVGVYIRFGRRQDVALYCRVATEDDRAIAMQELLLKAYADANGYEDDGFVTQHVYRDNGVSGLSMDRPGMNNMMEDIRAGGIRTVIVQDISRVCRDYRLTAEWLEFLGRHDVTFISVNNGIR